MQHTFQILWDNEHTAETSENEENYLSNSEDELESYYETVDSYLQSVNEKEAILDNEEYDIEELNEELLAEQDSEPDNETQNEYAEQESSSDEPYFSDQCYRFPNSAKQSNAAKKVENESFWPFDV